MSDYKDEIGTSLWLQFFLNFSANSMILPATSVGFERRKSFVPESSINM